MADYPDYTDIMQIVGSDIMVPMDIQGSYIMIPMDIQGSMIQVPMDIQGSCIMIPMDIQGSMIQVPVDIQAQYVTLDIDIVAQSVGNITIDIAAQSVGNIAINLAASDITLNVDISAQTIENLKIDIDAQHVGIWNQAEWAAKEGTDKNFVTSIANRNWGEEGATSHEVPSGKALYICGMSFAIVSSTSTDYDHHLHFEGGISRLINATRAPLAVIGGDGGNSVVFTKPIKFLAGWVAEVYIINWSDLNCKLSCAMWGYEIED